MYVKPRFLPGGDSAIFLEFGNAISPELGEKVRSITIAIEKAGIAGIAEVIPTYRSLLIHYDPRQLNFDQLKTKLETYTREDDKFNLPEASVSRIPVLYGGEFGPDLEYVANFHHTTPEEVIRIHTAAVYPIYMIGFMPGFPYLGGVSEQIATPRLQTPRTRVPAGSVGIAGKQTGIYPADSPGGWQIIGRTPLCLFNPKREPPALFSAGNNLSFYSIDATEFDRIKNAVVQGNYFLEEGNLPPQVRYGSI